MSQSATLVFPHQLFKTSEVLEQETTIYLVEEFLFFNQYKFHKQKIAFHRASMKAYENHLISLGKTVHYINAIEANSDVRELIPFLKTQGITNLHIIDPTDNWLEKHLRNASEGIDLHWYDNPLFINTKDELSSFFKPTKKKFFQTSFFTVP